MIEFKKNFKLMSKLNCHFKTQNKFLPIYKVTY